MQLLQNEIEKRTKTNQSSSTSSNSSSCTPAIMFLLTSPSKQKTTPEKRKQNLLSSCFDNPRSSQSTVDEFAL
ncbi:unnamed protein product [Rotaria sordida]|uniref:Uncharacterized protein n=1 Tax=Rotaria sordida TaxID=392033 RepID=A0A815N9Q5_9BILA|nr:unnamed protein product [Rotaria sordida]